MIRQSKRHEKLNPMLKCVKIGGGSEKYISLQDTTIVQPLKTKTYEDIKTDWNGRSGLVYDICTCFVW